MSLTSLSDRIFRVVRPTSVLVERQEVPVAVIGLTMTPATPALVEVTLWGSELTGTVEITGTVDGSPATEVVTFTGPQALGRATLRTCQLFSAVTRVDTSGLDIEPGPPDLQVRFVGVGNEAVPGQVELETELWGMLDEIGGGEWRATEAGGAEIGRQILGFDDLYDFQPRVGDLFVEQRVGSGGAFEDARTWEVAKLVGLLGTGRAVHHELLVVERPNRSISA